MEGIEADLSRNVIHAGHASTMASVGASNGCYGLKPIFPSKLIPEALHDKLMLATAKWNNKINLTAEAVKAKVSQSSFIGRMFGNESNNSHNAEGLDTELVESGFAPENTEKEKLGLDPVDESNMVKIVKMNPLTRTAEKLSNISFSMPNIPTFSIPRIPNFLASISNFVFGEILERIGSAIISDTGIASSTAEIEFTSRRKRFINTVVCSGAYKSLIYYCFTSLMFILIYFKPHM